MCPIRRHSLAHSCLEHGLQSHDIELRLTGTGGQHRSVRLILFSAKDEGNKAVERRIDGLGHYKGGRDAGIIFVLFEEWRGRNQMEALMKLQIRWISIPSRNSAANV